MTGPQRRVSRHQRNRASRAWVFGTAGLAAAAAAVGVAAVLVSTPGGQCLASTGTKRSATAVLARCDLGLSERWYHPYLGTDPAGRGYWQLRSAANGRCLTVGGTQADGGTGVAIQPCSSSMPWQQLITFLTAF